MEQPKQVYTWRNSVSAGEIDAAGRRIDSIIGFSTRSKIKPSRSVVSMQKWEAPSTRWIKTNSDGAIDPVQGFARAGRSLCWCKEAQIGWRYWSFYRGVICELQILLAIEKGFLTILKVSKFYAKFKGFKLQFVRSVNSAANCSAKDAYSCSVSWCNPWFSSWLGSVICWIACLNKMPWWQFSKNKTFQHRHHKFWG
jgi:hypothetical protein